MTENLKEQAYSFWQQHPLGSYEINSRKPSREYFEELNQIRFCSSAFSLHLYGFDKFLDKKVLDVGCGPGWLTVNYAKNGANVTSVDLTPIAVEMAEKHLELYNLKASVLLASVEDLPLEDDTFDFVCCDGVIHHTVDMAKACRELFRVLKPGGRALISFYYRNWYLNKYWFLLTRFLMFIFRIRTPHGFGPQNSAKITLEDFGKLYDGQDNPIGKILSFEEAKGLLTEAGFKIVKKEIHYFPLRFLPFGKNIFKFIAKRLDAACGTMIYFIAEK